MEKNPAGLSHPKPPHVEEETQDLKTAALWKKPDNRKTRCLICTSERKNHPDYQQDKIVLCRGYFETLISNCILNELLLVSTQDIWGVFLNVNGENSSICVFLVDSKTF